MIRDIAARQRRRGGFQASGQGASLRVTVSPVARQVQLTATDRCHMHGLTPEEQCRYKPFYFC